MAANTSIDVADFYPSLTENNAERIMSITLAIVCILFGTPLLYSVVWFERFGSDNKRTLLTMFVAMKCWIAIALSLFVQTLEIARITFGPLPKMICGLQIVLKFAAAAALLLYTDATALAHYGYIFWLKIRPLFKMISGVFLQTSGLTELR